jgi:hypothetical protein
MMGSMMWYWTAVVTAIVGSATLDFECLQSP